MIGRDLDGSESGRVRSGWIREGEIQMEQVEGGFCELLELDWRRAGGRLLI